jgi:hypothetical protein
MSDDIKRIEFKLDRIDERINNIDVTLATHVEILKKQAEVLEIHVKRTDLLEKSIEPIKKHVSMTEGILKFISMLGVVAAIVEAAILALRK